MLYSPYAKYGLTNDMMTIKAYETADVVDSALNAMQEGAADFTVVSTASSYTHSLIYEILDNIKECLLQLAQRVLSVLNNYYLNNVKLLDKYREAVIERLPAKGPPITHKTYEYPPAKDYPKPIKATALAEKDIQKLHDQILNTGITTDEVATKVDRMIENFGKEVLEEYPDPDNIKGSVSDIVLNRVRGKMITVSITRSTVVDYIGEISTYKRDRDDLLRTKKALVEDYEILKKTYASVTKNPATLAKNRVSQLSNPDKEALYSTEYQRFANIHVEMMRLFNGYIAIYQAAFDTKLNELLNKINDRKNVISEIWTRTGLFAEINTKDQDRYRKPIPYQPELKV